MKISLISLFLAMQATMASAQTLTRITEGIIVNDIGSSQSCNWVDYDNDGNLDVFVANRNGENNFLYKNNGDGSFTKITSGAIVNDGGNSESSTWGDYDNDGDLDVFVTNKNETNFLYRNDVPQGAGFTRITAGEIVSDAADFQDCSWGDYDNDGDLDLFVTNRSGNNFLYQNIGGFFERITTGSIVNDGGISDGCSWGDYDNDGDLDLFVANFGENNFLYENNGDGTFNKISTGPVIGDGGSSVGASWGDYDNDGDLDLFVSNENGNNFLYRNNLPQETGFTKITDGPVVNEPPASLDNEGSGWGDYDNDGDLDLFVGNVFQPSFLYENNGDGTFTKITTGEIVTATLPSASSAWGDFDNDGDLDLLQVSGRINNILYRNDEDNNNRWVNIRCAGTASNTSAIGAKVRIKAAIKTGQSGIWQLQEISAKTGRHGQNSLNAEFGLGEAAIIDSIRIEWPSGIVQDTTNVAVDQFLTITERQFVRITTGDIVNDSGISFGSSWGDYDNDGDPDLFVANAGGQNNLLYRNDGLAGFTKVTSGDMVNGGGNSQGSTWGDYDNDGDLDLFVSNFDVNFLYRNDGNGTFTKVTDGDIVNDSGNSQGCSWGDFDNDGDLDLFVSNSRGENNFLYRNEGPRGFIRVTEGIVANDGGDSFGCSWSDYDKDGDLDLFVANIGENFLYRNDIRQGGDFTKITGSIVVTDGGNSQGGSWADYDNDGDPDLLVTNLGSSPLYRNDGLSAGLVNFTKIFTAATVNSFGSGWNDYDNDGDLDLFVANGGANFLYENIGNDNFTRILTGRIATDGGNSFGSSWGDFNLDGTPDLFVANSGNNFLYQTVRTRNHWLNVLLQGRTSNASAIGAKIRVTATTDGFPVEQTREISGQTGYLSQNSLNAEFGFGKITVVDSLRIAWPSGAVNRYANIAADQFLTFQENNRPRVANEIVIVILSSQTPEFVRDLNAEPVVLVDSESDVLSYSAVTNDSNIATADVSSSSLTIALVSETALGQATITVAADDGKVDDGRGDTEVMTIEINRPPFILNEILDRSIFFTSEEVVVANLKNVFVDPDGNATAFTISSSDSSIAIAGVSGDILTVTPGGTSGKAVISILADDLRGGIASLEFSVTNVTENTPPRLTENRISDQILLVGAQPFTRELSSVFTDAETPDLNYTAISSNLSSAVPNVSSNTLIVIPRDVGMATITVRANDGLGGEASTEFLVEVLVSFRPGISHNPLVLVNPGQAITIEANLTDDEIAIAGATLNHRVGGAASFETTAMDVSRFGIAGFQAMASIPGAAVTDRGVEYFITAQDTHGVEARFPTEGVFSVQVRVDNGLTKANAQPAGDEQTSYRLISIPLELDDKDPAAILEDNLGPYDPSRWRLFQWVALPTGEVAKVEFPSPGANDMSPGLALWLIVKDANKVIDIGPGTTVSTAQPFSIPVNKGWNLIGNPFNFPTIAADTLSDGSLIQIFAFGSSGWSAQLPTNTLLQPFEGYAVFAGDAGNIFIKPNPVEASSTLAKRLPLASDENEWSIRILARCQAARDENNLLAVNPNALNVWDPLDSSEPPGVGEYVSVYFPHSDWNRPSQRFSADVRPEPSDGAEWEFQVESNIRDVVNLAFEGLDSVPDEYGIWLVDKALKTTTDLRQRRTYSVAAPSVENPKRLTLVVGKKDYVDEKLAEFDIVPTSSELAQNFPNPFNPATTIQYGLPNSSRVTVRVFNILGKEVATLVNDELQDPGYHLITWDGRNASGTSVSSGVYFYQMRVRDGSLGSSPLFVRTRKMLLIE